MRRRSFARLAAGKPEPKRAHIYALRDPVSGQVRYVGKTHIDPRQRLHLHMSSARKGSSTNVAGWLRGLMDGGFSPPEIVVLETVSYAEWPEAEAGWLRYFQERDVSLLNMTGAGGGP